MKNAFGHFILAMLLDKSIYIIPLTESGNNI
jgi:hypothetical protein